MIPLLNNFVNYIVPLKLHRKKNRKQLGWILYSIQEQNEANNGRNVKFIIKSKKRIDKGKSRWKATIFGEAKGLV